MKEEWMAVNGFKKYEVSNHGRVMSFHKKIPFIMRNKIHRNGYSSHTISCGGRKYFTALTHRLVARAFIPNPEGLSDVNHKDGNKLNNHVDNLEWMSRRQNYDHSVKNGLHPFGERMGHAKVTDEMVVAIRREYIPRKVSLKSLGENYGGLSEASVHNIITRKTWRHVQ